MLSNKAKYALKAAIALAREFGQGPVMISDIAQRERVPRKFLELILLELRHGGILQSRKGKAGGYFLAREPGSVSLGEILRVVEGSLAPIPCVSKTAYMRCRECRDENSCEIRIVMKEVHRCYHHNFGFCHFGRRAGPCRGQRQRQRGISRYAL